MRIFYGFIKDKKYAKMSLKGGKYFFKGVKGKIEGYDFL